MDVVDAICERLKRDIKVNPATGCWEWHGPLNEKGYGRIFVTVDSVDEYGSPCRVRKHPYVHRVMLAMKLGRPLEENELARHKCDNPRCCNPDHLEPGTVWDNVQDAVQRGRHRPKGIKVRRLTVKDAKKAKLWLSNNHSVPQIAKRLKCGIQTVRDIRDGRTWKDVKIKLPIKLPDVHR